MRFPPEWLSRWLARKPRHSAAPLGLEAQQVSALKALAATPAWTHYLQALQAVAEQQAAELASGLPHDKYLFTCGALHALRRAYTLIDDVVTATQNITELTDARQRASAERERRARNVFLNTPWYDGYIRDRIAADAGRVASGG